MSLRAVVPMGEDGINSNNAISVVRMAGADELYVKNNPIFWLMHPTVAAPTSGQDCFKGVAIMIPTDKSFTLTDMGKEQTPHRFVNVYARLSIPQPDGRCRILDIDKALVYGDVKVGMASTVFIVFDEDDEKHGNVVIKLTSNHSSDCLFTIVARTPEHLDHHIETTLGASRLWDVTDDTGMPTKEWYWHYFMTSGMIGMENDGGYVFNRHTIWEVSTVTNGIDTHVFNIAFHQNNES